MWAFKKSGSDIADAVYKDITKILDKYTGKGSVNKTVISKGMDAAKGFYLVFVKKDESMGPDSRLMLTTFGEYMSIDDIINSLASVIERQMKAAEQKQNYA